MVATRCDAVFFQDCLECCFSLKRIIPDAKYYLAVVLSDAFFVTVALAYVLLRHLLMVMAFCHHVGSAMLNARNRLTVGCWMHAVAGSDFMLVKFLLLMLCTI